MASKGSVYAYPTEWDTFELYWYVSNKDVINNKSTITWEFWLHSGDYGRISSTSNKKYEISIGGNVYSGSTSIAIENNQSLKLASGTTTLTHNADGTFTTTFSFWIQLSITFDHSFIGKVTGSETVELDRISKAASITNAPHFNDEENPSITYSNLAGNLVDSLQACISLTGANSDIAYRDIDKLGTSYTFNLTEAEREVLRNSCTDAKMRTVFFYVKTVFNGETFYSWLAKNLTIVNAEPVFTPAAMCWDDATIALTGSTKYFIKDFSNAKIEFNAQALKGASIVSTEVTCGTKKLTADGIIEAVPTATFVFTVTDSRGYSTTKTLSKQLIDYLRPTCNLSAGGMSATGDITLTITGQYYNGSFHNTANELTVEVAYKMSSSSIFEVVTADKVTLKGNTYTATVALSGLDYRELYNIQATAIDKLLEVSSAMLAVRSIPVFDWSGTDFNFNVPVAASTINGKDGEIDIVADTIKFNGIPFDADSKILWRGNSHANNSQTINLSETVSNQKTGIVLVFSRYDNSTNEVLDTGINTFFISKKQVELMPGAAHSFILAGNSLFTDMGAKTLNINDGYIGGYEGNTNSGSSGFAFNNANYVLRYVIGV